MMNNNYKYFTNYLACPFSKKKLKLMEIENSPLFVSDANKYPIVNDIPLLISKSNYDNVNDEKFIKSIEEFWDNGWQKRSGENDHSFLYQLNKEEFLERLFKRYELQQSRGEGIGDYLSNEIKLDMLEGKTSIIIGPGCGEEAMELSLICKAKVIGIDISPQSASLTNSLLHKFCGNTGIGIQGDSRFLPIQSNSIDFVFSSGVIHHSPNIEKSVSEIQRVLKPRGKFCVALYHKRSINWLKFLLKAILKGNWSMKKLENYISKETEVAWITENKKNPYTKLFSSSDCHKLFDNFKDVNVRAGNFYVPNNWYLKFFSLIENTKIMSRLGSMIYISGSK